MPEQPEELSPEARAILAHRLENGRTVEEEMRQFHKLAEIMDSKFNVLGIKFGVDSILGMIPIVGDVTTGIAGLYALGHAVRLKLPTTAKIQIIWNLIFDTILGAIPLVGDIFDFFFRSNTKNFRVVEKHLQRQAKRAMQDRLNDTA